MNLVQSVQNQQLKDKAPVMEPGDTVRVHTRIVEGDRERVQVFQGTVIRMRRGNVNSNFTVRRIASDGIGVERTFLTHSPRVEKVEVMRHGRVRRAQLYYLRGLTGKAARLKGRREDQAPAKATAQEQAPAQATPQA